MKAVIIIAVLSVVHLTNAQCNATFNVNFTIDSSTLPTYTVDAFGLVTGSERVRDVAGSLGSPYFVVFESQTVIELVPGTLGSNGFETQTAQQGSVFAANIGICGDGTFVTREKSDDRAITTVMVYPNPSDDEIVISSNAELRIIEIYSLDGKCVMNIFPNSKSVELNISVFAKGVYLVNAQDALGQILNEKFIKN